MRDLINLGDLGDPAAPEANPALIDCRDWEHPRTLSHGELDRQVDACARALVARGLARGDRVAILSLNRAELLIAYFAIMRSGFVAIPTNIKFPHETVAFVLSDAEVRFVFCDTVGRALLPERMPVVDFDSTGSDGFAGFLDPGPFETIHPQPGEAAMVLYTSGSTGRPKGVPLSHDGQLWAVRSRLGAGGHDRHRILVAAPLFHMNALGIAKVAIAAGATIVLLPQFNARHYVEAIGRFKVTSLSSVPTMLALALREHAALARTDLSSVEIVRTGSAPITQSLIDEIKRAFPQAKLAIGYGTTESGPIAFGARAGLTKPDLAIGWPLPGVGATMAAHTPLLAAPMTCLSAAARIFIQVRSRACWSATTTLCRPVSYPCRMKSRARSRSPLWCSEPAQYSARMRSSVLPSTMPRRISIRAA